MYITEKLTDFLPDFAKNVVEDYKDFNTVAMEQIQEDVVVDRASLPPLFEHFVVAKLNDPLGSNAGLYSYHCAIV